MSDDVMSVNELLAAKDVEIEKLRKDRDCPDCHGNPVMAAIAKRMGHRPDIAFAAVRKAESRAEAAEILIDHIRNVYPHIEDTQAWKEWEASYPSPYDGWVVSEGGL